MVEIPPSPTARGARPARGISRAGPSPRRADLAWGARQGAFFAAGFTALGAVGWLLGSPDLRADVRAHWVGVLALYWGGGTLSGLLVGACRPGLHRRGVALLLGALIGTLFMVVIAAWSMRAGALADRRVWCVGAGGGVPLGVACAWTMWGRARRGAAPPGQDRAPAV